MELTHNPSDTDRISFYIDSNCENIVNHKEFNVNNSIFPKWEYYYGPIMKDLVYDLYKNYFIKFNYDKNFYSPYFTPLNI